MTDVTAKLADALRLISFASMDRGARDTATEALRKYDAAKVQPVQDERAAFEAWLQKCHPGAVGAELIGKEENSPDTYVFSGVNKQWAAWQARAAQAATPAPAPAGYVAAEIYAAWRKVGADVCGLKWGDFVDALRSGIGASTKEAKHE